LTPILRRGARCSGAVKLLFPGGISWLSTAGARTECTLIDSSERAPVKDRHHPSARHPLRPFLVRCSRLWNEPSSQWRTPAGARMERALVGDLGGLKAAGDANSQTGICIRQDIA